MEVVMVATSTSRSQGFPSSWACSASFTLFDGCGVARLRRRPSLPLLPLSGPTLRRRPSPLLQLRCSPSLRWPCGAAPSPPEPPFEEDRDSVAGLREMFCRMQDAIRIFFAVFFWMSLFFWASAWDKRDDIRPNKRPPFRR